MTLRGGQGHDAIFSMDFGDSVFTKIPRTSMKCLLSNFTCATEIHLLKAGKNWSK